MDFIDSLKQFSLRVGKIKEQISTEEATKMSLIIPFFQLLGYDVFNPDEFLPEYTADVGIKKGEKVDYAILKEGSPVILIEAKWCGENLDKHGSQLFRYFGTTTAKFGILTNGITYKFYTDLNEANKMDTVPFLEFDLLNIKESTVNELKKFAKDNFDIENIFSTASELKYSKIIKEFMSNQLKSPSAPFVKYILSEIYDGIKTQNVIDKFKDVVKKSLNDFMNETMNEKISSALKGEVSEDKKPNDEQRKVDNPETEDKQKIITTREELECFYIIKSMLREVIPAEKITYKDTESYFGILYDNNTRKWICRLNLDTLKKQLYLPDSNRNVERHYFNEIDGIYEFKDSIIQSALRYADK